MHIKILTHQIQLKLPSCQMNNTAHPCHLPNSSKVATFVLGSLMEKAGGQVCESNGSPNYCDVHQKTAV
jgi:hypothetical protein